MRWHTFYLNESDYGELDYPIDVLNAFMNKMEAVNFVIVYSDNMLCSEGESFYIEGIFLK